MEQPAAADPILSFLVKGGPALWAIAALSVAALAVALWKVWALSRPLGRRAGEQALSTWHEAPGEAIALLKGREDMAGVLFRSLTALQSGAPMEAVREATEVDARAWLQSLASGTRLLELTVVIAPLLGLLGTVLGMIDAFRTLEEAGSRADPSLLAGGIWEALLTTAAGMAVAIPASIALSWVEARRARAAGDLEVLLARLFLAEASR